MDVYGIETTVKKNSGSQYFGFTLKGDEPYYDEVMKDMEVVRKKFGFSSKKLILLACIKLASKSIKQ